MDLNELQSILTIGETVAVEFKRCGNGIENDTYETVCSFLNRFGGDLFLGVLDNGTVVGVPEKAAPDMVKNFIKVISNSVLFSPTIYLVPEIIKYDEKRTIIHVHIPPSAEVHSYKKIMDTVVGSVVQNPKNPALWGIRNEDKVNWAYQKADGTQIPVAPGKTAGIAKGVKILFPESTGEFK